MSPRSACKDAVNEESRIIFERDRCATLRHHCVSDGRIHDCKMKTKSLKPGLVFRDGKPVAVILEIEEYQKLLERLEDIEDLKLLEDMRKKPLKFKPLEEAMVRKESPDVL